MSNQTIQDLRARLFAAIDGVKDGSVSIEQARTIGDLSQVIVNTAKVEVDFVRATERRESLFLEAIPIGATGAALPNGITGVRRHLLADD